MGRRRDEIADLAHDFDQMAAQLQELVAARDRLLADVSHELRTPLARLNLAIALARQDPGKIAASLDRVSQEAAKLDEMVGELLTLSKLETGQRSSDDYFDFAELAKEVIQDAGYEAAAKQVSVVLQGADDSAEWIARGNGRLVSRAVENIVRNAVRYSPPGRTGDDGPQPRCRLFPPCHYRLRPRHSRRSVGPALQALRTFRRRLWFWTGPQPSRSGRLPSMAERLPRATGSPMTRKMAGWR